MHSGFVPCSLDYRIVSILRREQHRRMRSEIMLIIRFKARARPEYAVNGGEGRLTVNWTIGTVRAQLEHTSLYIALYYGEETIGCIGVSIL